MTIAKNTLQDLSGDRIYEEKLFYDENFSVANYRLLVSNYNCIVRKIKKASLPLTLLQDNNCPYFANPIMQSGVELLPHPQVLFPRLVT